MTVVVTVECGTWSGPPVEIRKRTLEKKMQIPILTKEMHWCFSANKLASSAWGDCINVFHSRREWFSSLMPAWRYWTASPVVWRHALLLLKGYISQLLLKLISRSSCNIENLPNQEAQWFLPTTWRHIPLESR